VKRIIFSIFSDNVDTNHVSSSDYKLSQFKKYKDQLKAAQQAYANKCGADYVLHENDWTEYNDLQFEKILKLEQYANEYDQILYLDFDVVPTEKAENIFEVIDDSTIAMHPLERNLSDQELRWILQDDTFNIQNVFVKTCAKNSMLILEDRMGNNNLYNTGVVYGGKDVIQSLRFAERLDYMKELLEEAKEDSLFPVEISRNFSYNNEAFVTFLVERYDIPHTDLPLHWNFIMDQRFPEKSDIAYFLHHVNKEFEKSFT